jgi:mono/diheme cytochrome c family protein
VSAHRGWLALAWLLLAAAGCDNMQDQRNARAYAPSSFFADGTSARTPPAHSVPSGPLPSEAVGTGAAGGRPVVDVPLPVTLALLRRGRDQYNAQCAECHGEDGYGRGIVVRRGFPAPLSLHDPRLRSAPAGHIYDVIARGSGIMYPAGYRVAVADRWAIVAYVRALQLSQHATLADVPAAERARLLLP